MKDANMEDEVSIMEVEPDGFYMEEAEVHLAQAVELEAEYSRQRCSWRRRKPVLPPSLCS